MIKLAAGSVDLFIYFNKSCTRKSNTIYTNTEFVVIHQICLKISSFVGKCLAWLTFFIDVWNFLEYFFEWVFSMLHTKSKNVFCCTLIYCKYFSYRIIYCIHLVLLVQVACVYSKMYVPGVPGSWFLWMSFCSFYQ